MAHTVFKSDRTQNYILLVAHYLIRLLLLLLSLSLSRCYSLWLMLLRWGALSWLISWLQPLWRVNWRRRCLYLCIYGPASYPAAAAGGVFISCTRRITFYSYVCMYVFLFGMKRATHLFFFLFRYPCDCGESRFLCGRPTLHTRLLCSTQQKQSTQNKFDRLCYWWD